MQRSLCLFTEHLQRIAHFSFQATHLQFTFHVNQTGRILRIRRPDGGVQFIQIGRNSCSTQGSLANVHLCGKIVFSNKTESGLAGKFKILLGIAQEHVLHIQLSFQTNTPPVLLLNSRQATMQAEVGSHPTTYRHSFLQGESLGQCRKVYFRTGMKSDVRVTQQIFHLSVGQDIGMSSLETEYFQISIRGLVAHEINVPAEFRCQVVNTIR